MPTKLQFYSQLADYQTKQITDSRENWTNFLSTAGRLYKYPFDEQLMIYAQRPDATICAPLETWNKSMNLFVRKGSKGIALIDHSGDRPRIRYVFDYADTVDGRHNAKKPFVWEMKAEYESAVIESIDKAYEIDSFMNANFTGYGVGNIIFGLANELSVRYYNDNRNNIGYSVAGSFLEDYDEYNISVAFKEALTISVAYCIMTRCGIDPSVYIDDEDFQPIFDFNTLQTVNMLGEATSAISQEVLREIEVAIKKYERERSRSHERTDIQQERGLPDTRYSDTGYPASDQIRNDAEVISQGTPEGTLQSAGADGETVPPLSGDRAHSDRETGTDDERPPEAITATKQSNLPDGLDSTYEQPERTGGGNNPDRIDIQLNNTESETPSEMSGVSASSSTTITEAEIDDYLKAGSLTQDGKYRIFSYFLHEHETKEKASFLKDEYGYGGGTYFFANGIRGHAYATPSNGITLAKGGYSTPDAEVTLTWAKVSSRIDKLINDGLYMSQNELDRLPMYERRMLGSEIMNFYSNLPEDIHRPIAIDTSLTVDYWGEARRIGNLLDNPETVSEILNAMRPVMENTPAADRYYMSRKTGFDSLTAFENGTFTLFPGKEAVPEAPMQISLFPTESEQITTIQHAEQLTISSIPVTVIQEDIDNALINWNGDSASVHRVAEYMSVNSRSREAAAFLQNEYGKSEFVITKDGVDSLTLPWHRVQRGIAQLMEAERFMRDEPEKVPESQSISNPIIETEPNEIHQERYNFRITDDHLGEGGAKLKASYNINAIRTLKQIEAENRFATPEEQETLSRYVGWGGIPQIFDADNSTWKDGYNTLSELLTPDEYEMARASTLNAHYTSPTVIKAMYDTLERVGVKDGNILEPSCGVGNFLGLIPDSMSNAKLYGVELDSITGRIAKQLYPNADIKVAGFEKTDMPDAFFDVAVGNVPFGSYKLADKRYDKQNFLIHDYFFAKALDQVRPGGIVAFITSKGTLDKQNIEVRKYLAQRAELLGAVRLPNTAFKANAGTEVTSDIIFLQKRDRLIDIQPDWVNTWHNDDGIQLNRYFVDNPHMILGKMATESTQYGHDTTCQPIEGADLGEQLREALSHIQGQITEIELDDIEGIQDVSIPADPSVRNFSYTVVDGMVYFRENSRMNPVDMPATTLERVKGMAELRDCVRELIDYQLHDYSDYNIQAKQAELNTLYDSFTLMFGLINDNANNRAFSADSAYYLLCSLEVIDEDGKLERKSDMFTKRTIKQKVEITSVDTSAEALAVSIAKKARVDIDYMKELTGFPEEKIISDLTGVIFFNPQTVKYETADEYLSGNVREKLRFARKALEVSNIFIPNIRALEQAQPKDLDASEISVRLGTTWIDKQYIQDFMFDLLQPSRYLKYELAVNYSQHTGEWNIAGKSKVSYNDVLANVTYGTSRATAYKIIEETLNLKDVRIYDIKEVDGRETRVLNKQETTLAQQKQEAIKQAFKDWIFRDPERRQTLVKQYNEQFNSIRPREYDGSHIEFTGISPEITLAQHQKDAVARILYGGNTLLAHEVGAGKTFEMVGAAMESKRLGLCNKSLMAVPNHLTEQMASEFLRLYPSANILVATKKDFETKNRKKFCAKIATGDYDAVIIGHSQLEKIPLSRERQERLLNEQIDEITDGIQELKDNNGERFTIKQLEKTKKSLEARLEKLSNDSRKDDVVTYEQLGVDRLFVDESHMFKNLFLYTKMRNVAGLSTSEAQKSSDMFMKCRYMDEITGNKGVIFATGTPVTNSIAELYTVQRYLQYDTLRDKNLAHFDCWASTFGETQTSIELSPEGSGYRARTRFAKFTNLPELMSMFKEVADIKTADTLNSPRPKANFHTIVAKPSDIQKAMVKDLSKRAKEVHKKSVDPSVDNMLKITSDGRKIGLDQRLMNSMLPDDETSKVHACMNNIFRIWEETAEKKSTQLCFCDFSTPNADGRFNVYNDIKTKLIAKGIPEHEIAFIHDANTEIQKKELFAKVRKGQVRILFGSTFKCGAGTNVQDKLVALHDLDCPWRPADLAQRAGRIVRRGNDNAEVDIFRYCTEATFDSYLFQTVEKKQQFISQIMTSKSPVRSCDDVDEDSLSYAEIKALCAGNPLIKEKMQLDIEVAKLKLLKSAHQSQQYRLQDALLTDFPKRIEASKAHIENFKADISRLETNTHKGEEGISPMTIGDKTYTDRGQAGAALLEACKSIKSTEPTKIGSYRGFDMVISFDSFNKEFKTDMKGSMTHSAVLGDDSFGNITRINNAFEKIPQRLEAVEGQLQTLYEQVENAKTELDKPFSLEQEFTDKSARLAELDAQLNMDEQGDTEQEIEAIAAKAEPISAKAKPSILETLKQNTEKSRQIFGGKSESEKTAEVSI